MSEEISRAQFIRRGLVGAAALSVPAAVTASHGRAAWQAQTASSARRAADTLVVLEAAVAQSADWDGVGAANPATQQLISQAYQGLVDHALTKHGDVLVPDFQRFTGMLAESWEHKGNDWTFHLRRGIVSCAGNELTADDVVWSFARAKNVGCGNVCSWFLANVSSVLGAEVLGPKATAATKKLHGEVKKIDKYTVQITQTGPNAVFPAVLAVFCLGIVDSKEAMKHASSNDPYSCQWMDNGGTAGFGAYCIQKWDKANSLTLAANPNFKPQRAHFANVVIRQVPANASRVAALLSGDADVVTGLSPQEYEKVQASGKAKALSWIGNTYLMLGLNYRFEPWSGGGNPEKARLMRQAIAYAIPYDQIVKQGYFGHARKWNGLVNTDFRDAVQFPGRYTTNLDKARALLKQAGHPNGEGLRGMPGLQLIYIAEKRTTYEPIANFIRTSLSRIGVDVKLTPITQAEYGDRYINPKRKDMPMYLDQNVSIVADAGYMSQLLYIPAAQGGLVNGFNYDNKQFTGLYTKQKNVVGAARTRILRQMQEILMDDLPGIPIVEEPAQVALRKDLTGYAPRLEGKNNFNIATLRTV